MKRILTILFFLYAYNVYSQGFPWELSPRFPFYIPVTYVGLDGYYSMAGREMHLHWGRQLNIGIGIM